MIDQLKIIIDDPETYLQDRQSMFEIQKPNKQQTRELMKYCMKPGLKLDELLKGLYFYYEQTGIHDFLINRLYGYTEGELNFFMTQICYLCIQRGSISLEKFLVDKSATSASLFLLVELTLFQSQEIKIIYEQVRSIIDAYSVNMKLTKEEEKNLLKLKNDIEKSYVDGMSSRTYLDPTNRNTQDIIKTANEKGARSDYIKLNDQFLGNMVNYSLLLKGIEKPEQKGKLREFMENENMWIINQLRKSKQYYLRNIFFDLQYEGITIPFRKEPSQTFNSTLVVRIIPEEVTCFNTRTRVPYRVAIETIEQELLENLIYKQSLEELKTVGRQKRESQSDEQSRQMYQQKVSNMRQFVEKLKETVQKKQIDKKSIENDKQQKYTSLIQQIKEEQQKEKEEEKKEEMYKTQGIRYVKQPSFPIAPKPAKSRREIIKENKQSFNEKFPQKKKLERSTSQKVMLAQKMTKFQKIFKTAFVSIKTKKRAKSVRVVKSDELVSFVQSVINSKKLKPRQVKKFETIISHMDKRDSDVKSSNDIEFDTIRKLEPWGEFWEDKKKVIKSQSDYNKFKSYKCRAVIFKGGDDLRQEILAMQLIYKFQYIFQDAGLKLWLRPYEILVISDSSGILEFLPDTHSIDALKKKVEGFTNLYNFYQDTFGDYFDVAQKNFIESLAAYSIVSYLLQFKDRHNGNILINNEGRLIHIDFGFMFSISPGNLNWENAPFKLTKEYGQLMGGIDSDQYSYYKDLVFMGFQAILDHVDEIMFMVQIMKEESDLPCFKYFNQAVFRQRFREDLKNNQKELRNYVEKLIYDSYDSTRTNLYDYFQLRSNGIQP